MLKGIITSERSAKGKRLCILLDLRSTRKQDKLVWTLVSQGNTKHFVSLPCQSLSAILGPFLLHAFFFFFFQPNHEIQHISCLYRMAMMLKGILVNINV